MSKESKIAAKAALVALVALGITGPSDNALAADKKEKCYGVAAKGMNDCGNQHHSCGGQAKKSRDPNEWVYVPEGLCQKLAGGSTKAKK